MNWEDDSNFRRCLEKLEGKIAPMKVVFEWVKTGYINYNVYLALVINITEGYAKNKVGYADRRV